MAAQVADSGVPIRPAQAPMQPLVPPRTTTYSRPGDGTDKGPDASPGTPATDQTERRTMTAGRGFSLSGDIRSCERLGIEGSVAATLQDGRVMEIAEAGL